MHAILFFSCLLSFFGWISAQNTGDPCSSDSQCALNNCGASSLYGQFCGGNRATCQDSSQCTSIIGFVCESGTCRQPVGYICTADADCTTASSCGPQLDQDDNQSCGSSGSTCTADSGCRNSSCNLQTGKCRQETGGSCNNNDDCTLNKSCDTATKTCLRSPGNSCSSSSQCTFRNCGDDSTYGQFCGGVRATCQDSSQCASNFGSFTCVSGTCRQPVGFVCTDNVDCTSDSSCGPDQGGRQTCGSSGATCTADSGCQNQSCNLQTGKCREAAGGSCNSNDDCELGTTCDSVTGNCAASTGNACETSSQCTFNNCGSLTLYGQFCGGVRATCQDSSQCASNFGSFTCVSGTCRQPVRFPCSENAECTDDSSCGPIGQGGLRSCGSNGATCTADTGCINESCNLQTGKCREELEGPCDNDNDCASDYLCNSVTKTCGYAPGEYCDTSSQCAFNNCATSPADGTICGGVLATCSSSAQCSPDFSCSSGRCSLPISSACETDEQCTSKSCVDSICVLSGSPSMERKRRRALNLGQMLLSSRQCSFGSKLCMFSGARGATGWECVAENSLEACGCNHRSPGVDCSAIEHAAQVSCTNGSSCLLESCMPGYQISRNGTLCH